MSDIMLLGVLEMPPSMWYDDALDIAQRHSRYKQAAQRIRDDEALIDAKDAEIGALLAQLAELRDKLHVANNEFAKVVEEATDWRDQLTTTRTALTTERDEARECAGRLYKALSDARRAVLLQASRTPVSGVLAGLCTVDGALAATPEHLR